MIQDAVHRTTRTVPVGWQNIKRLVLLLVVSLYGFLKATLPINALNVLASPINVPNMKTAAVPLFAMVGRRITKTKGVIIQRIFATLTEMNRFALRDQVVCGRTRNASQTSTSQ